MKMSVNVSVCSLSLLLLLECVRAEPAADLQTLKRMLVEEMNGAAPFHHHLSQVEVEVEEKEKEKEKEKDAFTDKSLFEAPQQQRPWDSSEPGNSALAAGKESVLARLLKDLMRTSKRSWSRYKKGGQRSCFGVRLERIGSFSGLGC